MWIGEELGRSKEGALVSGVGEPFAFSCPCVGA